MDEKKIELLEFENNVNKSTLEKQKQYIKSVNKMIHGVQAPLATLATLLNQGFAIQENVRTVIEESIINIDGLVQDLLNQHEQHLNPPFEELVHKIEHRLPVTRGKTHGIGLTQIYHTLDNNQGSLAIHSAENVGTKISVSFPLIAAPEWMAKMMVVNPDDIIVILDNDQSNHEAWDVYFEQTLLQFHDINIRHFTSSVDAIAFIHSLSEQERQRILMLTDYELISQDFDGLKVLDTLDPDKTLLVTGQFIDTPIQQRATRKNTKIIPKQLVNQIPIYIQCKQVRRRV
jgi:hypothetical protein